MKPGVSYTFKIVATQIIVTKKFITLDKKDRDCSLPVENDQSNLTNFYSKSNCEYECSINFTKEKLGCLPWNIPRLVKDKTNFCTLDETEKFQLELETFVTSECDCPSDCFGTSFSVFDFSKPIDFSELDCAKYDKSNGKRDNPKYVFCDLCKRIIKHYKIRLLYNFEIDVELSKNKFNDFCQKMISKNVATVKIEMATKSITRSVKDKRFSVSGQLSSLGKKLQIECFCF